MVPSPTVPADSLQGAEYPFNPFPEIMLLALKVPEILRVPARLSHFLLQFADSLAKMMIVRNQRLNPFFNLEKPGFEILQTAHSSSCGNGLVSGQEWNEC
jgi:hypothetical protein